jgi:hypothetical protein
MFRQIDTDGSGFIDLDEFKASELSVPLPHSPITADDCCALSLHWQVAMFTVDPVSGNTLGFEPNKLLSPKDAFEVRWRGMGIPQRLGLPVHHDEHCVSLTSTAVLHAVSPDV